VLYLYHVPDWVTERDFQSGEIDLQAHRVGGYGDSEWRSLSCVFLHPEIAMYYYQDTRLTSAQVVRMVEICRDCQMKLEASGNFGNYIYKELLARLAIAVQRKHGIIALCD